MANEKEFSLSPDLAVEVKQACDTLRLCTKISDTYTAIGLHQNKVSIDSALKAYGESVEALKERYPDNKDNALLTKEFNDLNKQPLVVTLKTFPTSKFPASRDEFGSKEIQSQTQKGDLMVNRVNFFDSYVQLYSLGMITEVVAEAEDKPTKKLQPNK